jgi:hypothetical protein
MSTDKFFAGIEEVASNVVEFNGSTTLDMPPDKVLQGAMGQLTDVVVIGYDKDGKFYIATSTGGLGDLLLLVKLAERSILDQCEADE